MTMGQELFLVQFLWSSLTVLTLCMKTVWASCLSPFPVLTAWRESNGLWEGTRPGQKIPGPAHLQNSSSLLPVEAEFCNLQLNTQRSYFVPVPQIVTVFEGWSFKNVVTWT